MPSMTGNWPVQKTHLGALWLTVFASPATLGPQRGVPCDLADRLPSSASSRPEPPIERIWKDSKLSNPCRIRMAWIDEHVVGLGNENAAYLKARGLPFRKPPVAPRACHRDAPPPVGRQLSFRYALDRDVIWNLDLDEAMRAERIRIAHAGVNEYFEHRGGRVWCAVEDLLPARVPAGRGEEPSAAIERLMLREAPEDHA